MQFACIGKVFFVHTVNNNNNNNKCNNNIVTKLKNWYDEKLAFQAKLRLFFTVRTIFSTWGTECVSKRWAYGIGISAPVTRNIGPSR